MWWSGPLTADHRAIVEAIDALCDAHATDADCAGWDLDKAYPHKAMDALAAGGWAALAVAPSYGGEAATAADLSIVHRALGRRSLTLAQTYYSLWVLGAEAIHRLGTPAQRELWLPQIARGAARIAFALTEPGSGSDAAALRTRGTRRGDGTVVNGQKVFITGAQHAERIVTAVRTSDQPTKHGGISLLMIDPAAAGVTIRPLNKIGIRGLDLCEVFLDDVYVPDDELLGTPENAWRELGPGLARERLYLAAISVGALTDLIGRTVEYASSRETFGRPIGGHQLIADKIVRMRIAADAGAGLVRHAAELVDAGAADDAIAAASVAKLHTTEAYVSAAREATQVFGGYGFTEDYPVARHYRDCKYLEIGGGTSEIQTIVIARSMGLPV
jgi:alkylation response protein AidB-like acyl-CoA dehydrogenase